MPEYQKAPVPQHVLEDLLVAVNDTTWEMTDDHYQVVGSSAVPWVCACGWNSTDQKRGHALLRNHQVRALVGALQHEVRTYLTSL